MKAWFCARCNIEVEGAQGQGEACALHPEQILVDAEDKALAQQDKILGRRLAGRYAIYRVLGAGGFGITYQALDEALKRQVAVKILKAHPQDRRDPHRKERFQREAHLLARLEHPAIVAVYDQGEVDAVSYLVMAWIDGTDLTQWIETSSPSLAERIRLFLEVLEGLAASHDARIVHRDLKPANIMVTRTEPPRGRLIDFGIAKDPNEGDLTQTGMALGTMRFMAPELGRDVAHPTLDIFAVGVMLSDALGSDRIFPEKSYISQVQAKQAGPPALDPAIPPSIAAVIARCLAPEPSDRFATASELTAELRQAMPRADGAAETAIIWTEEVPPPSDEDRPSPKLGWVSGLVLLTVLGLGFLLGRFTVYVSPPPDAGQNFDQGPPRDAGLGLDATPLRDAAPHRDAAPPRDAAVLDMTPSDPDARRPALDSSAAPPDASQRAPDAARLPPRLTLPPGARTEIIGHVNGCRCVQAGQVIRRYPHIPNYRAWTRWVSQCRPPGSGLKCPVPPQQPPGW